MKIRLLTAFMSFLVLFLLLFSCVSPGCPPLQNLSVLGWSQEGNKIILLYNNLQEDKQPTDVLGKYNTYLYSYDLNKKEVTKHLELNKYDINYGYFDRNLNRFVFTTKTTDKLFALSLEGQETILMEDVQPPSSFPKLFNNVFQISSDQNYIVFGDKYVFDLKTKKWAQLNINNPQNASLFRLYLPYKNDIANVYGVYALTTPEIEKRIKNGMEYDLMMHHALFKLDPQKGELSEVFLHQSVNSMDAVNHGDKAVFPIFWNDQFTFKTYLVENSDGINKTKYMVYNSKELLSELKLPESFVNSWTPPIVSNSNFINNMNMELDKIAYINGDGFLAISKLNGESQENLLSIRDNFPKGGRDLICSLGSVP